MKIQVDDKMIVQARKNSEQNKLAALALQAKYAGGRKSSSFDLPGPGTYLLRLRYDGYRDYHLLVEAGSGASSSVGATLE